MQLVKFVRPYTFDVPPTLAEYAASTEPRLVPDDIAAAALAAGAAEAVDGHADVAATPSEGGGKVWNEIAVGAGQPALAVTLASAATHVGSSLDNSEQPSAPRRRGKRATS